MVRLARVVRPVAADGTSQIVYYHPGVGTGNGLDRLIGGGTGVGLARNVRDAYAFLVNNYRDGDEIFLFGFSRGAYTARSVAGLIGRIGLLRKQQMGAFLDAWAYSRLSDKQKEHHRPEFERLFPDRVTDVSVRCIGVWDTVGAFGIPPNRFTGNLQVCRGAYQFLNVTLGPHVRFRLSGASDGRKAGGVQPSHLDAGSGCSEGPSLAAGLVPRGAYGYRWRL